jgi:hypothetical protein
MSEYRGGKVLTLKSLKRRMVINILLLTIILLFGILYLIPPEKRFEITVAYAIVAVLLIEQSYILLLQLDLNIIPVIFMDVAETSSEPSYKITNYSKYPVEINVHCGDREVFKEIIKPSGDITIPKEILTTELVKIQAYNVFDRKLHTELIYNTKDEKVLDIR